MKRFHSFKLTNPASQLMTELLPLSKQTLSFSKTSKSFSTTTWMRPFSSQSTKTKIANLPLTLFKHKIYRPNIHPEPFKKAIGWVPHRIFRGGHWNSNTKTIYYWYDTDHYRVKDLTDSKIIGSYISIRSRLLWVLGSTALLLFLAQEYYAMVVYGETVDQHLSKKKIDLYCQSLNLLDPTALTNVENEKLNECKQGCQNAAEYQAKMGYEMGARRFSRHGSWRFFGLRTLDGVYDDKANPDMSSLLSQNIHGLHQSISQRQKQQVEADRKKRYEELLASSSSKGLKKKG